MLPPTFLGFNVAQRGMAAAQYALNVISNNVANANTEGYSRQRADLSETASYGPILLENGVGAYAGQGVTIDMIGRAHDNYIDAQVRDMTSQNSYHSINSNILKQVESLMGEPVGAGINKALNDFFQSANVLSANPEDTGARASFIQTAKNFLGTVQSIATQVKSIRTGLVGDPDVAGSAANSISGGLIVDVNSKLTKIAELNDQISKLTNANMQPNDMLDKRDLLLSQLSESIDIKVSYMNNNNLKIEMGGNVLVTGNRVVNSLNIVNNTNPTTMYDTPALIQLSSDNSVVNDDITGGKLAGYLKMGSADTDITTPRTLLKQIDTFFTQFATQVNSIQGSGYKLDGTNPTVGVDDEIYTLASGTDLDVLNYRINTTIESDPNRIAAADGSGAFAGVGDGKNALAIANIQNTRYSGIGNLTIQDYYNSAVSVLGVSSNSATDSMDHTGSMRDQLVQQQQSVQGVNVQEEMVNLMQYQRAFEASSRAIKVMDEMLQAVLSMLG